MKSNTNSISQADLNVFEGSNEAIAGQTLFDIVHRYTVKQITGNWNEAHPNGPELRQSQVSNRLATAKAKITRETGRGRAELNKEVLDAQESVEAKQNGKVNQEHDIPYTPRATATMISTPVAPTPTLPLPANHPSATASGPSATKSAIDDGEEGTTLGDEQDAVDRPSPIPRRDGKKRTPPKSEFERHIEGRPDTKRPKKSAAALSKKSFKAGETGGAVETGGGNEAVGALDGGDDESGGAMDADQGAGQYVAAEKARGAAGGRNVKYGGASLKDPNDPQSIEVQSEWNGTKRGPSIVRNYKEDVELAPRRPKLTLSQYKEQGMEGTARLSQEEQAQLRKGLPSPVVDAYKAAEAGEKDVEGEVVEGIEEWEVVEEIEEGEIIEEEDDQGEINEQDEGEDEE